MKNIRSATPKPRQGSAVLFTLAIATALTLFSAAALGETPAEKMQAAVLSGRIKVPITPIPAPAEPNAIRLYPDAKVEGLDEQWDQYAGGPICRNVVHPTITPFLPDPAKATGAAVIFAPGGAFVYLGMEDAPARQLVDQGVAVFVLKYRLVPTPRNSPEFLAGLFKMLAGQAGARAEGKSDLTIATPEAALEDAQAAVRLVRSRAAEWHVDASRVGFMGVSAGGMLAIRVGLVSDAAARPDFIGAISGPTTITEVPPFAPPLFLVTALDDPLFSSDTGGLLPLWRKAKRPVEAHFFERGGHGVATPRWLDLFHAWMKSTDLLTAKK